jgi:hypothetical protein
VSQINAWRYDYHISKEEYERRKQNSNDHCAVNNCEWASLTLTQDGLFACVSDYGDFIYAWGEHCRVKGQDFREFVSRIEASYLLGKTRREDEILQESSAEPLRLRVKELRECHNKYSKGPTNQYGLRPTEWCDHGTFQHLDHERHTAEWGKECLELIDNLTKENLNELYHRLALPIDSEDISYTYSAQAITFGKYVLPQLQRMIREELEAEKEEVQTCPAK